MENNISILHGTIAMDNKELGDVIKSGKKDLNVISTAHTKITMGLDHKTEINDELAKLNNKKPKLQRKKWPLCCVVIVCC